MKQRILIITFYLSLCGMINAQEVFTVNGITFEMVKVEGGTFVMGAEQNQDNDARSNEEPIHEVSLSDYYMGKYEVTRELWEAIMGTSQRQILEKDIVFSASADNVWTLIGEGSQYPVCLISWNDCQKFIQKLSQLTGKNFSLPTEAQWEYAARGGNKSKGYKYAGSNDIEEIAGSTYSTIHKVGSMLPNELGLYDMSGNVWEWCQDWYGDYNNNAENNPIGVLSGTDRVIRGGGNSSRLINQDNKCCRISNRACMNPLFGSQLDFGMRLVLIP